MVPGFKKAEHCNAWQILEQPGKMWTRNCAPMLASAVPHQCAHEDFA
jgi:hypothetical protein